jgi:DNA mismatch repair protein MutS2
MNARSLELLEYESLRAVVARYAGSQAGRRLLAAMAPMTERGALAAAHDETREAIAFIDEAAGPRTRGASQAAPVRLRFDNLPDVEASVARLRIEGASLEGTEIAALISFLERATEVRVALAPLTGRFPLLSGRASAIGDFRNALKEISGKVLPDGSVADGASVALGRIRRDIERQRRSIHDSLERFLKVHREDGMLQEEFITIRNERFVVPVLPGAKKRVPGVVHGSSGSGHTLFLEPLETIEMNNDLVRLLDEELSEIHRILLEISRRLREHARELRATAEALAALDLVFAKARFAEEFGCAVPSFSGDDAPVLRLKGARHPLLEDLFRRQRKKVVPVTLMLDASHRTLLISGPNTGGKTVAMKTVGLLALMAQSGLPVPAEEAEFPLFDDVLADIGDNQSIEQSLSSFSAHVARVKEMVEAATSGSLVLLDELGRATDPEEGGALGVAILDEFRQHGAFALASTHLLALKVYGANTEGVVNASMGFNEQTLEPTYVLRTGSPGKSAGLDIATRLGLPERLIERARGAMSSTERDIARFLNELESRITEAASETDALKRREAELAGRESQFEKRMEQREAARVREFERRAEEAQKAFDKQAQEIIERLLSSAEQRKQAERALRDVARAKREFSEQAKTLPVREGQAPVAAKPAVAAGGIKEGMRVKLKDVSGAARVRKVLSNGRLEVEVGNLKVQVRPEDVLEVLGEKGQAGSQLPEGITFKGGPRWDTLTREINVIGKTGDDAVLEVDEFLDSAFLAGVTRIRVIHGHGMGILKKRLHEVFKKHPLVAKYELATSAEGGTGATIVEIKEN